MKKLLAMVLALVMTLSLAVSANAAFKDEKDISDEYAEAVAVLNGMGVFKGYEDETFKPEGKITRAEVATIIYRIYTADVAKNDKSGMYATYNKFSDMAGAGWAAGYIGYCANAELVKGYPNGTFQPSGNVKGYEVLAMILRAVGYDKNGEFTGADWALNVAKYAEQAGVLKNIKGVDLNAPATRELVAEMLFRGIADAATVTYTPAFGYQTEKVQKLDKVTLGSKNFELADKDASDDWGRPGTKWTYNTGDKETLVLKKAAATYTTKVDECDIAKDLGITKSKAIEAAYIDGDKKDITDKAVTSNQAGNINPLATTSYVGGQGRLTEVYNMGADGYRIVEINTYLAKVDKVTAAKTDRNGHTTKATVNLTVYGDFLKNDVAEYTFEGVKAEGFTVDQYVLVTVLNPKDYKADAAKNKASVESIVAAELVAGGKLTGWTNEVGTTAATHVVAGTTYNDANKFFLHYHTPGTKWLVALDSYGNAIGLVENATSYAAVARIEWRPNTNSFGGYALADLILADGTLKENVTVSSVNDKSVNGVKDGKTTGAPNDASVALYWNNNNLYYQHIVSYSVNADGSYNLMPVVHDQRDEAVVDYSKAAYFNGSAYLLENTDQNTGLVVTDNTVFLYINENGYSYTVYTGKDKAPSFTDAELCVKSDSNGYAELVLVKKYTDASNTFIAFIPDAEVTNLTYPGNKLVPGYNVYKLGETKATVVYDAYRADNDEVYYYGLFNEKKDICQYEGAGLYVVTMTSENFILGLDQIVETAKTANDDTFVDGDTYKAAAYGFADAKPVGNAFAMNGVNVVLPADDAAYIKVENRTSGVVLTAGSKADIEKGTAVLVTCDYMPAATSTKIIAKYVYVFEDIEDIENVKEYAVAVRLGDHHTDTINLTRNSINVENYKITESVNGADATNYAYLKATAKAVIEKKTFANGEYKFVPYTTAEWTVTCPATGATMSALLGSGDVTLEAGVYKVTVTVSNDDIGTLDVATQEFDLTK